MADDQQDLERRFLDAMLRVHEQAKEVFGYNATYFLRMVRDHGGVGAAKLLLRSPNLPAGLLKLRGLNAFGISMEAVIAENTEWWPLFTRDEINRAEQSLRDLGYEPRRGRRGVRR